MRRTEYWLYQNRNNGRTFLQETFQVVFQTRRKFIKLKMNIFYLHEDPVRSAQLHCDKHVVKMIIEYAQMLSTAHRMLDGTQYIDQSSGRRIKRWRLANPYMESFLYKASHINHPSAVWVRENAIQYQYMYDMFVALCDEYTYRYGKVHMTDDKLGNC